MKSTTPRHRHNPQQSTSFFGIPPKISSFFAPNIQRQQISEEEDAVQAMPLLRKSENGGYQATPKLTFQLSQSKGGGSPLPVPTLNHMNQAFSTDFSNVRVHTGHQAQEMNQGIQAKAFTHGADIYFNQGQYSPESSEGKKLLAHELTHVVQQSELNSNSINRTLSPTSYCSSTASNNTPPNALKKLANIDELAQSMALGCSHLLFLESVIIDQKSSGGTSPEGYVFTAYRKWFGLPHQMNTGKWRSRFSSTYFANRYQAIEHEMSEFASRFKRLNHWLAGSVTYYCHGNERFKIGNCRDKCKTGYGAISCSGSRKIAICPGFWQAQQVSDGGYASLIIHEAVHADLGYTQHLTSSLNTRSKNSACYQGFVNAIYNTGSSPLSSQCTEIP